MPHVCPFEMVCHAYVAEDSGKTWVLHVFDVTGEEDDVAIALEVKSVAAYRSLQDEFTLLFRAKSADHPRATLCASCRPENKDWLADFSDWVKAAYAEMADPPVPVDYRSLPAVVRHTFEANVVGPSSEPSSLS